MLARYQIIRGKRPPDLPLPEGERIDTRKHTRHVLRPESSRVEALLTDPSAASFREFSRAYNALLEQRFVDDRAPFDELAKQAQARDVYLGCNCPTKANPDVMRCHTVLALRFMKKKYPKLAVIFPEPSSG